jgi:hypothetical protein
VKKVTKLGDLTVFGLWAEKLISGFKGTVASDLIGLKVVWLNRL